MGSVPLCVETLKIFKVPMCVGSMVWYVETLKNFKVPLCVGSVVCGDFEKFQSPTVCGHCAVVCVYCGVLGL